MPEKILGFCECKGLILQGKLIMAAAGRKENGQPYTSYVTKLSYVTVEGLEVHGSGSFTRNIRSLSCINRIRHLVLKRCMIEQVEEFLEKEGTVLKDMLKQFKSGFVPRIEKCQPVNMKEIPGVSRG